MSRPLVAILLPARRIGISLVLLNLIFIVAHIYFQQQLFFGQNELSEVYRAWIDRWSMDIEASVPTWYAQILLFIAAVLLGIITTLRFATKDQWRWHWAVLVGIFLLLSIDEGATLHEMAIDPLQDAFAIRDGFFFFAWVIPALALLAVFTLVFFRFWWNLPQKIRLVFAVAFVVFLSGAIGLEMIDGNYWQLQNFSNDFTYALLTACEEGLENFGSCLFVYGLLLALNSVQQAGIPTVEVTA